MSRLALSLALAALATLTPLPRAHAATFTPDMWVYELELTADSLSWGTTTAFALAPPGTHVPAGCEGGAPLGEVEEIVCTGNPGIDLLATASESTRQYFRQSAVIGFNSTSLVCASLSPQWECPDSETIAQALINGSADFLDLVVLDGQAGVLEYCFSPPFLDGLVLQGCYAFRPTGLGGSALMDISAGGTWDYGFGGGWGGADMLLGYAVTGRLISAPTPVPLPAGLPLLALGLAAFGLMRRRRG